MDIPSREQAKNNHTFFYFYLLKSWLSFVLGDFSEATKLLEVAQTFPEKTKASETDDLEFVAKDQMNLQKSIVQCLKHEKKQTIGVTRLLSPEEFKMLVSKYQSNKKQQLLDCSDETLARYFIDPKHQKQNANPIAAWDLKEPGSVMAMFKMIRAMFNTDAELSLDFIKDMHRLALDGVILPRVGRMLPIIPGNFREEPVQFAMGAKDECSLEGFYNISDWIEKQNTKKNRYRLKASNYAIEIKIFTTPRDVEEQLIELIDNYRANIRAAGTIREVIKACASFSHEFVLIHPFSDGNLRLSQQLLNFLLAKNNLPLCILSEPFLIPGASPDELVDHILIGFHNFQHLMTKGYVPDTNIKFDTDNCAQSASVNNLVGQSIFKDKPDLGSSVLIASLNMDI
jgi:hypothetical protein